MDTSASPEPYHKKIKELQDEIIVLQEQVSLLLTSALYITT